MEPTQRTPVADTRSDEVERMTRSHETGRVILIGAGPGDPDLLTVRAFRAIRQADVVLYDALVSDDIVALAAGALRVDVGKIGGGPRTEQEDIHELLYHYASAGHTVVRLKGGDPFVFGRGSEEALYLGERGIPVDIVPGISSCMAAPAYAGIPVTHRNVATHFTVITGQAAVGGDVALRESWANAARLGGTIVFMMGVRRIQTIMETMVDNGLPAHMPVAVVQNGTCDTQRVVLGTIATIHDVVREAGIKAPAVIVVGDVVRLQPELARALALQPTGTQYAPTQLHAL